MGFLEFLSLVQPQWKAEKLAFHQMREQWEQYGPPSNNPPPPSTRLCGISSVALATLCMVTTTTNVNSWDCEEWLGRHVPVGDAHEWFLWLQRTQEGVFQSYWEGLSQLLVPEIALRPPSAAAVTISQTTVDKSMWYLSTAEPSYKPATGSSHGVLPSLAHPSLPLSCRHYAS